MDYLKDILQIPDHCLVNKKITKAFFKRNFDLTLSEKKLLEDFNSIIQIDWLASIKQSNTNIQSFETDQYVYEEIQIISLKTGVNVSENGKFKIIELIQKNIPYHILLCVYNENDFILNTCDKRVNQNDQTKRIVEKTYYTDYINFANPTQSQLYFIENLNFLLLDKDNLKSFYDSYTTRIIALKASSINDSFAIHSTLRSKLTIQYLENISILQSEILNLQNQALKETQLSIQVQINLTIQQKRKEIKKLENLIIS